jgi:hypothetical protein
VPPCQKNAAKIPKNRKKCANQTKRRPYRAPRSYEPRARAARGACLNPALRPLCDGVATAQRRRARSNSHRQITDYARLRRN